MQYQILYRPTISIALWSCLLIVLTGCIAIAPEIQDRAANSPHTSNNVPEPKANLPEMSYVEPKQAFTQLKQDVRNVRIQIDSTGVILPSQTSIRVTQPYRGTEGAVQWIQTKAYIRLSITNYNDVNIYVKPEAGILQWGDITIDLARQMLPQAYAEPLIVRPSETQEREIAFVLEPHHISALHRANPALIQYTIDAPNFMGDTLHDLLHVPNFHFMFRFQHVE